MLEQYFFKPDTVDQVRSSWLGEPIERYVIWLSSQDYAPHHIRSRVPILRRFAQFVWSRGGRMFEELPDPGGDRAGTSGSSRRTKPSSSSSPARSAPTIRKASTR